MWLVYETEKILPYEAWMEYLKFAFRQLNSCQSLLEDTYSLYLFYSWSPVLLREASWGMTAININVKGERRGTWKIPMLCQHALTDLCDLASSLTVWIIIKSYAYGRQVTECHLSCHHREDEEVLKERHGNVFLKSFLISEGKTVKTMLQVDAGKLLVQRDQYHVKKK